MNHTLSVIFGFSIIIPAIIGVVRIKKVDDIYLPFLFCVWIGFINEILNYILVDIWHGSNAVNTDIYCLVEALLYCWLFKKFNLYSGRNLYILIMLVIGAWITDNFLLSRILSFDSYFTILYSLLIVLMSITIINRLITANVNLYMNSTFILCCAFIIYFSTSAMVEILWLYGLNSSRNFRLNIYRIMTYINLFINLIFAYAILWMHRKQEFIPLQ